MAKYYNEDVKLKYLDEMKNPGTQKSIFRMSAPYEKQADKDIAEMDRKDVIEILKRFNHVNILTARSLCVAFNHYYKWYKANILKQYSTQEPITIRELDMYEAMQKSLFQSWKEVMSELVDYDYQNGDPTAPVLALNWLGFKTASALSLTDEQVDWKNGLIYNLKHKLLIKDIDPEIMHIFEQYKTTEFGTRKRNHIEHVEKYDNGLFIYKMDVKNTARDTTQKQDHTNISHLIAKAALNRKESRGTHNRTDYPEQNPEFEKEFVY